MTFELKAPIFGKNFKSLIQREISNFGTFYVGICFLNVLSVINSSLNDEN